MEGLDDAVALVRSRLDALADGRRRDTALTDGWQGGHRDRFEAAIREIELRVRRVNEALALVALAGRRARDEQMCS